MPSKRDSIVDLAAQTARKIAAPLPYMAFLETAAQNFKYSFRDQLLIHAQRPEAAACAELRFWNRHGRWVNRGAKGIGLLVDTENGGRLRYVFDVSDTSGRTGGTVPLWRVEERYRSAVVGVLCASFEEIAGGDDLPEALAQAAEVMAADNYSDYIQQLEEVKRGSLLEDVDPETTRQWFMEALANSIGYMLMTRCGVDPRLYYSAEEFRHVGDFNTLETISILGGASSDIAEELLREIAATVRELHRAERKYIRTFAKPAEKEYAVQQEEPIKIERGMNHGSDLPDPGGLPAAQSDRAGTPAAGQIRDAAPDLPADPPEGDLHRDAAQRPVGPPSAGDRPASAGDDGAPDHTDGPEPGRDGEPESIRPDEVGGDDEPDPGVGGGGGAGGADLSVNEDLPTIPEQLTIIAEAEAENASASIFSQDDSVAPPALRRKGPAFQKLHPEIPADQRRNFHITDNNLGAGTSGERFARNTAAVRLLHKLEYEDRLATPDEQEVLSRYVGWGGLADCFDEKSSHYHELKNLLSDREYASARSSTLNAHYTSPTVIKAIYEAVSNMGFRAGNILEPSCGVGNFFGLLPEAMAESQLYGVELDSITGRIARQLYPNASIAVEGFESASLPDSFFDLAIGNVPFGQYQVDDKRYNKLKFNIHNYFFAKTLDKIRPGGVIAFVTSRYTLDAKSPVVRRYLAERATLLGAVRLPNNAFKANAGTEVVSDILFLQKKDAAFVEEPEWVHLAKTEEGFSINSYFAAHPNMVLGVPTSENTQYGRQDYTVAPVNGADLAKQLHAAIQNIAGTYTEPVIEDAEWEEDRSIPASPYVRNFSYTQVDGKVFFRENSRMNPAVVSEAAASRIKGLMEIRDTVRDLIERQMEDWPDEDIHDGQIRLNRLYDAFVDKYGRINDRANRRAFDMDSSYYLLCSLEILDDEGQFLRKADMFEKRTIRQRTAVRHVDTASEALAVSLAEKAAIDLAYMVELTGKSEDQIISDLSGVIFLDPPSGQWQTAGEYLSGNVRAKLAAAKLAAENDPRYASNIQALEKVQPADLTASEISVRLGATWLPADVVASFLYDLFETPGYLRFQVRVLFSKYTGEWNIEGKSRDKTNIRACNTYGTARVNGYKILEDTLNLRTVRVFDYRYDDSGRKVPELNKKETAVAQGKQELIKQAFQDWVWKDPERRERLCKIYNERFNSTRPRTYDGSHLTFSGMNPEITLRPHQTGAIAHILYGGNTLLAHVVGAGKTYEMVAAAQESKRLGLCQKSLFVVPNHLTEQWAAEYLQLYPAANILVARNKDFETKNRKKFCGRISTGDYDAVIIGHSQFEKIPLSLERQRFFMEQQLEEIVMGITELKQNRGERFSVKQLEKSKKTLLAKISKLNDQSRKDDVVTFEELGVDRLFVDEAHFYKNLAAFSKMQNVGGISQVEAQKSSDLYMKCRYMDQLTGGRGVIFATGTPISNTMVEMYTMQKYLQYNRLKENGLLHFDAWASTFGETVTAIELAPEGTGYRSKTRFAKFYNLPELMSMFREVADIQTADMLKLPVPKANYHHVVLKPSPQQREMVAALGGRAERIRGRMVDSSVDNMLLVTNDGRKLALDQRLLNPLLPDSETSKTSACAENVFAIWQRTASKKSAQMIFCDLSIPKSDGSFNVYDDIRDKLLAKGIPAGEIAYIHSANTEAKKKELFGKVRSGQVRVLIGSTQKMGAGTNAQQKLIALHHTDCPWRPADLQQREGRIIRQGNENQDVEIYTYVTENTFDSYLYQLVEGKQKFIGQIMTSKSPARSADDIDETALSYAEVKALCSGNPLIKEKMDLDVEVQRLKLLRSSHMSQQYALEDAVLKEYPRKIAAIEQQISGYSADIQRLADHTHLNEDGFSPMSLKGTTYRDKKEAGSALLEACQSMTNPDPVPLGSYRGFEMELYFESFTKEYRVALIGDLRHTVPLGTDIYGNMQRLDNALNGLSASLHDCKAQLEYTKRQCENAREEVGRPFPREEELKAKSARLDELNIALNLDKRENEIVDGEVEHEPDAEYKPPVQER